MQFKLGTLRNNTREKRQDRKAVGKSARFEKFSWRKKGKCNAGLDLRGFEY